MMGKSDPVDPYAAATAVLSGLATGTLKSRDGVVEAVRALWTARRHQTLGAGLDAPLGPRR
ncbi:hypothetical protein ACFWNK_34125 [Streptomyces sp. NPDC058417]|uniref:hypothetical protein n=1 Tax=unclassified Streptomyces TaxID=2593676 RepID=UPI003656EAD7